MSSFFFSHVEKNRRNSDLYQKVERYAVQNSNQFFLLDAPLVENTDAYAYEKAVVVLSPKHKILLVNLDSYDPNFDLYVEDFKDDLAHISKKYQYIKIIGRPREWEHLIETISVDSLKDFSSKISEYCLEDSKDKKTCELLISLLTGSINDVDSVKGDIPEHLLDKIKQKIVLFDGEQTRFIYNTNQDKVVTIQGLSGTGKTELLLHKLREVYVNDPGSRIMFTCFNKVLADSLRKRIPSFFNFMKVEEQIEWNSRLWCLHSWGSGNDYNSGAYRYICYYYGLSFLNLKEVVSFDDACRQAIEAIKKHDLTSQERKGFAFDYMLVDESQDFGKHFKELCTLVTSKQVYFAGDVFQSIFGDYDTKSQPDFLLSKCYRTDPHTLMFAHGLGLGLFEPTKLRWLAKEDWIACGYQVDDSNPSGISLTREPLRRFEDLKDSDVKSVEIIKTDVNAGVKTRNSIIESIRKIFIEHPTVKPEDIGIIFMDTNNKAFNQIDVLAATIYEELNFSVTKAYEVKTSSVPNEIYITNRNNVKGLEFPFVICICNKLNANFQYRNALYMMLTRSFIKSFLVLPVNQNEEILSCIDDGLKEIVENERMWVTLPTPENLKQIEQMKIEQTTQQKPLLDRVNHILDELDILPLQRTSYIDLIKLQYEQKPDMTDQDIRESIHTNMRFMGG